MASLQNSDMAWLKYVPFLNDACQLEVDPFSFSYALTLENFYCQVPLPF